MVSVARKAWETVKGAPGAAKRKAWTERSSQYRAIGTFAGVNAAVPAMTLAPSAASGITSGIGSFVGLFNASAGTAVSSAAPALGFAVGAGLGLGALGGVTVAGALGPPYLAYREIKRSNKFTFDKSIDAMMSEQPATPYGFTPAQKLQQADKSMTSDALAALGSKHGTVRASTTARPERANRLALAEGIQLRLAALHRQLEDTKTMDAPTTDVNALFTSARTDIKDIVDQHAAAAGVTAPTDAEMNTLYTDLQISEEQADHVNRVREQLKPLDAAAADDVKKAREAFERMYTYLNQAAQSDPALAAELKTKLENANGNTADANMQMQGMIEERLKQQPDNLGNWQVQQTESGFSFKFTEPKYTYSFRDEGALLKLAKDKIDALRALGKQPVQIDISGANHKRSKPIAEALAAYCDKQGIDYTLNVSCSDVKDKKFTKADFKAGANKARQDAQQKVDGRIVQAFSDKVNATNAQIANLKSELVTTIKDLAEARVRHQALATKGATMTPVEALEFRGLGTKMPKKQAAVDTRVQRLTAATNALYAAYDEGATLLKTQKVEDLGQRGELFSTMDSLAEMLDRTATPATGDLHGSTKVVDAMQTIKAQVKASSRTGLAYTEAQELIDGSAGLNTVDEENQLQTKFVTDIGTATTNHAATKRSVDQMHAQHQAETASASRTFTK